jgi:hypothetical protein
VGGIRLVKNDHIADEHKAVISSRHG